MAYQLRQVVRRHKRVGRGVSRRGAKSGRGMKGQKSRAGFVRKAGFEGGQTPLYMRLPKARGAQQISIPQRPRMAGVPIRQLRRFPAGTIVTIEQLKTSGMIDRRQFTVKLIGHDQLDRALTVKVQAVTSAARQAVEQVGGKVELVT